MFSAVYKKRCYDWDVVGSIQQTLPLKNLAKQTCKKRRSFFPRTVSDWNNLNESNPQSLPTRSRNLKTSSRLMIRTKERNIWFLMIISALPISSHYYARSDPVTDSVNVPNQDQDQDWGGRCQFWLARLTGLTTGWFGSPLRRPPAVSPPSPERSSSSCREVPNLMRECLHRRVSLPPTRNNDKTNHVQSRFASIVLWTNVLYL